MEVTFKERNKINKETLKNPVNKTTPKLKAQHLRNIVYIWTKVKEAANNLHNSPSQENSTAQLEVNGNFFEKKKSC